MPAWFNVSAVPSQPSLDGGNAQPLYAVGAQGVVDHRVVAVGRAHAAGVRGHSCSAYAARAEVDSAHHVIIAADVISSGAAQSILLPMIEKTAPYREAHILITGDSGNHSDASVENLKLGFTFMGSRNVAPFGESHDP